MSFLRLRRTLAGWPGYIVAVAAVAVATLARRLLDPTFGDLLPFLTYYGSVLVVAWLTSLWPSALALVLGAWTANYFFVAPRHQLMPHLEGLVHEADLVRYTVVGAIATAICEAMRAAERRAEEQAETLHVTLLSIGDAVICTDNQGRVTCVNPVAAALTGWSESEALGRPLEEVFRIVDEHTRRQTENPVKNALAEGKTVGLARRTLLIARDGAERPIDDSSAPIRDVEGKVLGVVLIFRDITERRRAEDELRRTAAELSTVNRRQSEFLSMLSHELRNPLMAIQNAAQIFRLAGSDAKATETALEMMHRQMRHMTRLVDDLLDLSRIRHGRIELRREPVELAAAVNQAVEITRPRCEAREQELTVALPDEPLYLNADPHRIVQIVDNLLHNACKFTGRGGRVRLALEREGNQALIRVQDTGAGIAADQLAHVFDMFVQGGAASARVHDGLGIGLTVVKNLTEMHGGEVTAHSAGVGKGSEFVVRLPLIAEERRARQQAPAGAEPGAAKRRILVADDNRDAAQSLAALLKLKGHDAHAVYDGLEAVEAAAKLQPDAILLDIAMPGLNGYEAARRIRRQQATTPPLLVALSGWGQGEDRRRSGDAGIDAHLVKPVEYDALIKLLDELDGRSASARVLAARR